MGERTFTDSEKAEVMQTVLGGDRDSMELLKDERGLLVKHIYDCALVYTTVWVIAVPLHSKWVILGEFHESHVGEFVKENQNLQEFEAFPLLSYKAFLRYKNIGLNNFAQLPYYKKASTSSHHTQKELETQNEQLRNSIKQYDSLRLAKYVGRECFLLPTESSRWAVFLIDTVEQPLLPENAISFHLVDKVVAYGIQYLPLTLSDVAQFDNKKSAGVSSDLIDFDIVDDPSTVKTKIGRSSLNKLPIVNHVGEQLGIDYVRRGIEKIHLTGNGRKSSKCIASDRICPKKLEETVTNTF